MENLKVIEHKGIRVLTTKQLAEKYDTAVVKIQQNFNNNEERYREGCHYLVVKYGEEAYSKFSNSPFQNQPIYLWTEKGCLLHAKSLNTEKAWEVYEILTDTYFRVMELMNNEKHRISLDIAESMIKMLRLPDSGKLLMYNKLCKSYNVTNDIVPKYAEEEVTKSLTELLRQNNILISAVKANSKLIQSGILEVKTRPSKSKGIKYFNSLTEKGLQYGKNLISPHNPRETQPHYYEQNFGDIVNILKGEN